ncbi:PAXIP1-associated protein-like protein, partial [Euroglyphus maynei]
MDSNDIWADCSDEETYYESNVHYRSHPTQRNVRLWEPTGVDIVNLYEQIKTNGYVELEWKCPGRISPSQLTDDDQQMNELNDAKRNDEKDEIDGNEQVEKTEFDFDNAFDDDGDGDLTLSPKNRVLGKHSRSQPMTMTKTKTTTNLTK